MRLLATLGSACDGRGSPTAATPVAGTGAPAATTVAVHGSVADTAFRPLGGARVEVVDGADNICTQLPQHARSRTYTATIAPFQNQSSQTFLRASLGDASFCSWSGLGPKDNFVVGVAGDIVAFSISDDLDDVPSVSETLGPDACLALPGTATVVVGDRQLSNISVPFDGAFIYCVGSQQCYQGSPAAVAMCRSANHRLTLTKR